MEIIERYNPQLASKEERRKWIKRFGCEYCGCEFEASKGEFRKEWWYGEYCTVANCPICGNITEILMKMED